MNDIDDLSRRWKDNPDASTTIEICNALQGSVRTTLVQQVADFATAKLSSNVPVLVAVARMYMNAQRLADAQAVLVAAGKIAPRDGAIYRVLGEVLLRRGDADRAEKVFERATQFGQNDPDTKMWIERARVYKPMQTNAGARSVAAEVARAAPTGANPPTPQEEARISLESYNEAEDIDTAVRDVPAFQPTIRSPAPPPAPASPAPIPIPPPPPMPQMQQPASARQFPSNVATQEAFQPQRPPTPKPQPIAHKVPFRDTAAPEVPDARDVLDALALAGVFERPDAATTPTVWARPDKTKRRGTFPLLFTTILFVGGSIGAFVYVGRERAKAHTEAEGTLTTVETDMRKSDAVLLPDVEKRFSHIFDLDSRSDRAALGWLRERALAGLLRGGQDVAFEEGLTRAREVKVKEELLAFAQIASFLFQGDTVGAASLLPKWDQASAQDPWYQLLAGATLERAGDPRARDRYEQAVKLDPDLIIAQVALIRATAVDGDPQKAMELAKAFRAKHPERLEGQALVALAWARDPARGEQAPPEVQETITKGADLPNGLRVVPHALAALLAAEKRDYETLKREIPLGLATVEGPGVASWLGIIALKTGDEALARRAALAAVTFNAIYPPARMLAARVALVGNRLDEALKATEDLDPTSPDVAIVRAAAAYERVDSTAFGGALEAVSPNLRMLSFMEGLQVGHDVLAGHVLMHPDKILDLADADAPWADLVAMDTALDSGDLDSAGKVADKWKGTEDRPLRAIRLARLARYRGKLDDADKLSVVALTGGTVTTRTLMERTFVLVARNQAAEVGPLIAKYPLVLGPLAAWLSAYAHAAAGKVEDARGKTSSIDPPPGLAPAPARVIAAAALGMMKDRRRGFDYIKELMVAGVVNPDVVAAGEPFAIKPPARKPFKK